MSEDRFVSRVFWPAEISKSESGYLIGWNISNFIGCVATVVKDKDLLCHASDERGRIKWLRRFVGSLGKDPNLRDIWSYCSSSPLLLGRWCVGNKDIMNADDGHGGDDAMFWLVMYPDLTSTEMLPLLGAVYCVGCRYRTIPKIIVYERDSRGGYFGSRRNTLAQTSSGRRQRSFTVFERSLRQANAARWVSEMISHKLRNAGNANSALSSDTTCSLRTPFASRYDIGVPRAALMINRRSPSPTPPSSPRGGGSRKTTRAGSSREELDISNDESRHYGATFVLVQCVLIIALLFRLFLDALRSVLSRPLHPWLSGLRPIQISQFCKQLHFRSTSVCYLISAVPQWERRKRESPSQWRDPEIEACERINFCGEMVRIAIDVLCGFLIGLYLHCNYSHENVPLKFLRAWMDLLSTNLENNIEWLMDVPVGMKLNQPLARQLGLVVLSIAKTWAYVMSACVNEYGSTFVSVASLVGLSGCGATALVALSIDFLHIVTAHIFVLYRALCALQHFQCGMLASLSKLFRGKKANVLRRRVDHCDYGMEQLIVGTLLFTTFLFLFLTISVYYTFFTVYWLSVLAARVALWVLSATIWYFPYYELWIFFRERRRLPGGGVRLGVRQRIENKNASPRSRRKRRRKAVYLRVEEMHASFASLFWRMKHRIQLMRKMYTSSRIVRCLLYAEGRWLDGAQRLSLCPYPGVPPNLPSPREFWMLLRRRASGAGEI